MAKSSVRTAGFMSRRAVKMNGPPDSQPWIWLTREILESPAFRGLSINAMRALFRIMVEHVSQGGRENGRLKVTTRDMFAYGVAWHKVSSAIDEIDAAGFIRVTVHGRRICGSDKGAPPEYALTWLPIIEPEDLTPPSNAWKQPRPNIARAVRAGKVAVLTGIPSLDIEGVDDGGHRGRTRGLLTTGVTGSVDDGGHRHCVRRGSQRKKIWTGKKGWRPEARR